MDSRNQLVLIIGTPLSGKTALAKAIEKKSGIHRIDIDDIRFVVAGLGHPHPEESPELMKRDGDEMGITYKTLFTAIAANLDLKRSLIVTGSFSSPGNRQVVADIAAKADADLRIVHCVPVEDTEEEVSRMLKIRDASFGAGGYRGTLNAPYRYFEMRDKWEKNPITQVHLRLNTWTKHTIEEEVLQVLSYLAHKP